MPSVAIRQLPSTEPCLFGRWWLSQQTKCAARPQTDTARAKTQTSYKIRVGPVTACFRTSTEASDIDIF